MAIKRMVSREVVELLDFDRLSDTAKMGYVYMVLYADDDGFVTNPKKVGVSKRTVEVLEKTGFVYRFKNGIALIRHWFVHNTIRKDMYKPTVYTEEKALVTLDINKVYHLNSVTEATQDCTKSVPQNREDQIRIDQNREEKINLEQKREEQIRSEESRLEKENRDQTVAAATGACGATLSDIDREKNFLIFWELYPNKCEQDRTKARFLTIDADFEEIMEGLRYHLKCNQWVSDDGYFIPKPYNWLCREGWKDRPPLHKEKGHEKTPVGATGVLGKEELDAIKRALAESQSD